jgi:hypothetical protein
MCVHGHCVCPCTLTTNTIIHIHTFVQKQQIYHTLTHTLYKHTTPIQTHTCTRITKHSPTRALHTYEMWTCTFTHSYSRPIFCINASKIYLLIPLLVNIGRWDLYRARCGDSGGRNSLQVSWPYVMLILMNGMIMDLFSTDCSPKLQNYILVSLPCKLSMDKVWQQSCFSLVSLALFSSANVLAFVAQIPFKSCYRCYNFSGVMFTSIGDFVELFFKIIPEDLLS